MEKKAAVSGTQLVLLVGVMAHCCYALEMARIHIPHGQDLTSSTLQWVDVVAGHNPPENAVHVTPGGPLWCRAKSRGTWTAGAVEDGKCNVPFLGKVLQNKEYDVLVSINGSARIIEVEWDRLQAIPDRGIATPSMLLAVGSKDGNVYPGYVSPQERRAYVLKDGASNRQDDAKILTEDEPVRYQVDHVVRNEDKSQITKTEEIVSNTTLSNPEKSVQLVTDMLDYPEKEMLYWGRIRGTITGLQAIVMDPSGNEREITWGIDNELESLRQQMVSYELPGEASIDVKLVAVIHKYEAPYSAKLTSLYSDGETRQHPISGLHIHNRLAELRADFSQPYFTSNLTEIPGEYIPSQILIHSTTTTTTTTTTNSPSSSSSSSTTENEKPQSDSLATSGGSTHTRPVAEHMSGTSATEASLLLSIISVALLMLTHKAPFIH
ncbi:protein unzipped-like isoform X1 [Macrobrachium rosenbergii]|uniref:protein unzipped-like isoform X1 n=1 Tax=Macrobrachium rosenbergii TaxID=79674 RepID=UPI0034D57F51